MYCRRFENCRSNCARLIQFLMIRAANLSILDWGILKGCLVSFGVLLGCSFSSLFKKLRPLLFVVFLATFIYTVIQFFAPLFEEYFEN